MAASRRRVRLADVARAAGVSVSTASRALNGYSEITESTRARVADVAAKLGYRAHSTARSLRLGDVGMVAAVIDAESLHPGPGRISYFWSQLLTEVTAGLSNEHLALLTVMEDQAPALLGALPYDVAVVLSTRRDLSHVIDAVPFGVPLVTAVAAGVPGRGHISLGHDYAAAMIATLDHLADAGAQRPAVLLPDLAHTHIDAFEAGADTWFRTYPAGVVRRGLPDELPALVEDVLGQDCDALFCLLADAATTSEALRAAGVEPGRDVKLVVLSDGPVDALLDPPVSTLQLLPTAAAAGVLDAVARVLRGESCEIVLPHHLSIRASSGAGSTRG